MSDPEVSFIANQMKQAQQKAASAAPSPPPPAAISNPAADGSQMQERINQEKDAEVKFIMKQSYQAGKKK